MPTTYDAVRVDYQTGNARQGSTELRFAHRGTPNRALHPVIMLEGWPGTTPWTPNWAFQSWKSLVRCGYTLITPWTGASWGHPTTASAPSSGPAGTGIGAIDDAITWAAAQGYDTDRVHLHGTSMGACNALAWAVDNAASVGGVYLLAPVTDLGHMWDQVTYRSSIESAWGTTGRTNVLTAAADADPAQNYAALEAIGPRTSIFCAVDDDIVGYDNAEALADAIGATITPAAAGGHVFPQLDPAYDETLAVTTFGTA